MKPKCNHKWVDVRDGTDNQFCIKCLKYAMQNRMSVPMSAEMSVSLGLTAGREMMEVPYLTPSGEHTRISVYKDDLIKRMHEEAGLSINLFSNGVREV